MHDSRNQLAYEERLIFACGSQRTVASRLDLGAGPSSRYDTQSITISCTSGWIFRTSTATTIRGLRVETRLEVAFTRLDPAPFAPATHATFIIYFTSTNETVSRNRPALVRWQSPHGVAAAGSLNAEVMQSNEQVELVESTAADRSDRVRLDGSTVAIRSAELDSPDRGSLLDRRVGLDGSKPDDRSGRVGLDGSKPDDRSGRVGLDGSKGRDQNRRVGLTRSKVAPRSGRVGLERSKGRGQNRRVGLTRSKVAPRSGRVDSGLARHDSPSVESDSGLAIHDHLSVELSSGLATARQGPASS